MVPRERSTFGWPALLWLMPAWPQQWPVAKVLVDAQLQLVWVCLFKCPRQPQEVWTPWNREFERGSPFFLPSSSTSVSCPSALYSSSSLHHPSPGNGFPIMLHSRVFKAPRGKLRWECEGHFCILHLFSFSSFSLNILLLLHLSLIPPTSLLPPSVPLPVLSSFF